MKLKLKKYNSITVFVIALHLFSSFTYAASINCKVVSIIDGDTIKCFSNQNNLIKIRLANIDAPESKQPFGQASKKNLSNMIFGKNVEVFSTGQDKYGRIIGTIYYQNININLEQVTQGYAWVFREFCKERIYFNAEQNAKNNLRGLWQDKFSIYPSIWRKTH